MTEKQLCTDTIPTCQSQVSHALRDILPPPPYFKKIFFHHAQVKTNKRKITKKTFSVFKMKRNKVTS